MITTDYYYKSKQNGNLSYILTLTANKLFVHINYGSLPRLQIFLLNISLEDFIHLE